MGIDKENRDRESRWMGRFGVVLPIDTVNEGKIEGGGYRGGLLAEWKQRSNSPFGAGSGTGVEGRGKQHEASEGGESRRSRYGEGGRGNFDSADAGMFCLEEELDLGRWDGGVEERGRTGLEVEGILRVEAPGGGWAGRMNAVTAETAQQRGCRDEGRKGGFQEAVALESFEIGRRICATGQRAFLLSSTSFVFVGGGQRPPIVESGTAQRQECVELTGDLNEHEASREFESRRESCSAGAIILGFCYLAGSGWSNLKARYRHGFFEEKRDPSTEEVNASTLQCNLPGVRRSLIYKAKVVCQRRNTESEVSWGAASRMTRDFSCVIMAAQRRRFFIVPASLGSDECLLGLPYLPGGDYTISSPASPQRSASVAGRRPLPA
ncbi:hypothetical protein R3P38DRAFT_2784808 [Favolaschia claudopus]|uniref:Uncharacterized protein n=1 Tax=Favolaschia claudopus TaxID=2862362 RepID=A0AAW0AYP0_9AGAR